MVLFYCFLFVSIFVDFSLAKKHYTFKPESRHIEVNDGEDYSIAFHEIGNMRTFGHCYIKSKTINADYPIFTNNQNYRVARYNSNKGFEPYNGTGICGFVYFKVNDKVPLEWTITAFDNKTKSNFTEKVSVSFYYNMLLYLDRIPALPTATIVNMYITNTKLKKCSLSFQNTTVDLDINSIKVYDKDNVFKFRLTSLGGGRCGYKINNFALSDPTYLTLYATDANSKIYRNTSQLVIIKKSEYLKNRTMEVYLGDSVSVICGKKTDTSANFDQKFCYLYNPKRELVSHDHMCDYHLDIVTLDDLGTWRCSVGYDYIMETLEFTTELIQKGSETVVTFSNDTTQFYIIGCQLANFTTYSLKYCKFTRPGDGKVFKVMKGSATVNYNTFSTDLHNGRCSLEIVKPLREEDIGTWKCEAAFFGDNTAGTFIDVKQKFVSPFLTLSYHKKNTKNVRLDNSFVIDCIVPYSSDYCSIIAPNGTQYKPENRLQITTGLCLFRIARATASDNGTWQCSIAQRNGIPDEVITVEISIIDLKILSYNTETTIAEDVELLCNTNGIPLEYCRFVSPAGLSYSLRQDKSSFNRISYYGRGLEYGDCGIKISKVELTDHGQWTCHISSGRYNYKNKADLTREIRLKVAFSIFYTLEIILGVLVGVGAIVGFILYRYPNYLRCGRRSLQEEALYTDRVSQGSNNSQESVTFAVNPQENTYETCVTRRLRQT